MRITKLKYISAFAIVCAITMVFVHMLIPHSHNSCLDEQDSQCCTSEIRYSEDINDTDSHYHCIITNSAYQKDTTKEINSNLIVLSAEHWGYIYSPIDLPLTQKPEVFAVFSDNLTLEFISQKLPNRAPPRIA